MSEVLRVENVTVSYGQRRVLAGLSLSIESHQIFGLMGPAGVGKSTLLHTISGTARASQSVKVQGRILYRDEPIDDGNFPSLLMQKAALMGSSVFDYCVTELPNRSTLTRVQQRDVIQHHFVEYGLDYLGDLLDQDVLTLEPEQRVCLSIARLTLAAPSLLCLDEPTAQLRSDDAVESVLRLIARQRAHRSVLLTTHNQSHAKAVCDTVGLLAGGHIVESASTDAFFGVPQTTPAREFVRSGSCSVPSPDTRPEELDPSYSELVVEEAWNRLVEESAQEPSSDRRIPQPLTTVPPGSGPRGFHWVVPGRLAGTPWPGIAIDEEYDLFALQQVGVTTLLTLTESPFPKDRLGAFGQRTIHFPIKDMLPPSLEQAERLCLTIDELLHNGDVVAVHCKAGKGRTGTVLAAYLVWHGTSAGDALDSVRRLDHTWVQSPEQEHFLSEFEANQ